MPVSTPKYLYGLIGILTLVNVLQATYTELIYDEAYYWYFSTQLDWGYFDHPPMVAWMIALGSIFFKGTLGVRIVGVLMSSASYLIIWKTISNPKKWDYYRHFLVLLFSMTLLNAYGFFSLPDTPLLFFTALLFYLLKRFYQLESWGVSIGIGLVMAALMYSKYHAVLVILGVIFGNLKLLKNHKAWAAVGISLLAYTPHLYWLYEHNFVSVAYHLFERPNRAYDFFDFGLGYWVNLIAIFGLTFPFVYQALFQSKNHPPLNKSMWGVILTVLLFFFISSFNRRIQTQWIVVICIPIAYLVFETILENPKLRSRLWVFGSINILIIMFLRLGLVYEPLLPISYEAHGNESWTAALKDKVGNAPVVFENSYRNAAMYAFYTGNKTHSLNSVQYRQNQYNIDGSEIDMMGKKVAYISKDSLGSDFSFQKTKEVLYYGKWITNYPGLSRLKSTVTALSKDRIEFSIYNPYAHKVALSDFKTGLAFLNAYKQFKIIEPIELSLTEAQKKTSYILPGKSIRLSGKVRKPNDFSNFSYLRLSFAPHSLPFLLGNEHIKISVWNPF